jgi:hypothetical protein
MIKEHSMVGRILLFPFWIIKKGVGAVSGIIGIALGAVFGAFRFVLRRRIGTAILVLLGVLIGKKIMQDKMDDQKPSDEE